MNVLNIISLIIAFNLTGFVFGAASDQSVSSHMERKIISINQREWGCTLDKETQLHTTEFGPCHVLACSHPSGFKLLAHIDDVVTIGSITQIFKDIKRDYPSLDFKNFSVIDKIRIIELNLIPKRAVF